MKPFPVTDHAVIRYMERVLQLDVETIRRHIGYEAARAGAGHEGLSAVRIDGWRYQLAEGQVVTVCKAHRPDLRTGRQRPERRDTEAEA